MASGALRTHVPMYGSYREENYCVKRPCKANSPIKALDLLKKKE